MKYNVCQGLNLETSLGTVEISDDVYEDDYAIVRILLDAGYLTQEEGLELTEDFEGRIDIFDADTDFHLVSLVLAQ